MTTIAADVAEQAMCTDSKCTIGDTWFPSTKIYNRDDLLIGCAGGVSDIEKFMAWYDAEQDETNKPELDNLQALVLSTRGLHLFDSTCTSFEIERGFHAVGTGGNAALGAMLAGKSLTEAVSIACMIDPNSGGDIVYNKLEN